MRKTEDNLDYLVDYVEKEYIQGRFGRGKENHKLQDFHQELGMFMHLFDVMYDLVDHVVTSQYLSEQRCKSPKQNSKLSPTYRKRAASCDSVGLFQVNI